MIRYMQVRPPLRCTADPRITWDFRADITLLHHHLLHAYSHPSDPKMGTCKVPGLFVLSAYLLLELEVRIRVRVSALTPKDDLLLDLIWLVDFA